MFDNKYYPVFFYDYRVIMFVCLFVCMFVVLRPTLEFFTYMETSPLPVKGFKF